MTSDGVNSYTWDRANRLLSMGSASYQYDGEGRRVQQTVSSTVTKYLLDIQPGLAVVLSETMGANTMRYVHSPRGIHAHKDTSGNWEWMVQDGLGSVREVVDNSVGVLESRNYDPYGNSFGATGTSQTGYGFTGELVDGSGLIDLRARRYNAALGTFASLDPFEGDFGNPMSLNGYGYVEGNPINMIDPSGNCGQPTDWGDIYDSNCYYSAVGLAQRFSNGDPTAYQQWFNVLIQKSWGELKGIEALGTVNDASILPSMALHDDPQLVAMSILEWIQSISCSNSNRGLQMSDVGVLPGFKVLKEVAKRYPGVTVTVGALFVGIGFGIGALLGVNAFARSENKKQKNRCDEGIFSDYIKCDNPNLTNTGYKELGFEETWSDIEARFGEAQSWAYSRRDDFFRKGQKVSPIGDTAQAGPCAEGKVGNPGRHWNIFSESEKQRKVRTSRGNPFGAIGRCTCCRVNQFNQAELVQLHADVPT